MRQGGAARRSLAAYGGSATNDYIYFRTDDDSFLVHSSATLLINSSCRAVGKAIYWVHHALQAVPSSKSLPPILTACPAISSRIPSSFHLTLAACGIRDRLLLFRI